MYFAALPAAIFGALLLLQPASAQFQPPATVFGSISDAAGRVDAGLPVEAYIGDTLCGSKGKTEFTGEGDARVTVYVIDVVDEGQTPGCGRLNAKQQVRIKIGDRFASQTATWDPGPVRLDVTFGNATPVPIPTFTPTPTRTPAPPTNTPRPGETLQPVATIPPGSPGAGSPVPTSPLGGITSGTPGASSSAGGGDDGDGGGVPVWAVVLLVLGAVGVIGGGAGYMMSRSQRAQADDDEFLPSEDDLPPSQP
jgi:hypothetical protein